MNILIDTERRRYTPSGLQFFCDNLLRGLSELGATDISIYGPEKAFGFSLEKFSPLHKFFNPVPQKYRLVHITHQNQSYFPRKFGETRILTVHDLNYLHLSQVDKRTKDNFIKQVAKNISQADHIVCISEYTRQDLLNFSSLFPGLEDKEITVVYNGLDTSIPYSKEELETHLPEELQGKQYLLNIGVANPKKNQQAIIEAMPRIDEDVVLVVNDVNNSYARYLRDRASEIGVSGRLHFLENVSDRVKHSLLYHTEALVFPSLIEGFGYPPVEAMVYGKPVILSRNGSLPEVGGDVALYLKDASPWDVERALLELKTHRPDPHKIREHVCRFSYLNMAKGYLDLYRSLL